MAEYITKDEALLQLTGINLPKDRDSYIALVTKRVQDIPAENVAPVKRGEWLRMSGFSLEYDDRWKCSRCGNVVHYSSKENLYTFNSWCGRYGSYNVKTYEPILKED